MSWDSFERYKQKGLDARRAGQWDSARIYLLEAARSMMELSKSAQGEQLKQARRDTAQKLLELARDCDKAKSENRRAGPPARTEARRRGGVRQRLGGGRDLGCRCGHVRRQAASARRRCHDSRPAPRRHACPPAPCGPILRA